MKIVRNKNNLVVTIPLRQKVWDVWSDKYIGETDNLIGVIVKGENGSETFEQGIYQAIDMSYKGKGLQLGMPIIMTSMDDDEFIKLCHKLEIEVQEYPQCIVCKETLWGTRTYNDKGPICTEHEDDK